MDNGFELLTEKETMWAEMLGQVLKDNDVPYVHSCEWHGVKLKNRASGQIENLRSCG